GFFALTGQRPDLPEPAPFEAPIEPEAPILVRDEPAGPAGEGAPGEIRDRRPPRAAASLVPAHLDPTPDDVARLRAVGGPSQPVDPDPPLDPDAETGELVVAARQEAEVYIGGQFVDRAPVRRELPPGRYAVSLVARDGRRRTFEVEIQAGKRIRRTWDFDRTE